MLVEGDMDEKGDFFRVIVIDGVRYIVLEENMFGYDDDAEHLNPGGDHLSLND